MDDLETDFAGMSIEYDRYADIESYVTDPQLHFYYTAPDHDDYASDDDEDEA